MGRAGIVLLCGRSFSGKSTVAAQLADGLGGEIISLDDLNAERGLWGGDGIPIEEWARTMDLAHDRVTEAIGRGATVIIDDTRIELLASFEPPTPAEQPLVVNATIPAEQAIAAVRRALGGRP